MQAHSKSQFGEQLTLCVVNTAAAHLLSVHRGVGRSHDGVMNIPQSEALGTSVSDP